jgi:hypothetical protein
MLSGHSHRIWTLDRETRRGGALLGVVQDNWIPPHKALDQAAIFFRRANKCNIEPALVETAPNWNAAYPDLHFGTPLSEDFTSSDLFRDTYRYVVLSKRWFSRVRRFLSSWWQQASALQRNPFAVELSERLFLVKAERASFRSRSRFIYNLLQDCGLTVRLVSCTGLVSQNNTPSILVPLLKHFDGEFSLGEYVIAIAEKT